MSEKIQNQSLNIESPFKGVNPDVVAAKAWASYYENPGQSLMEFGGLVRLSGSERILRRAVVENRSTFILGPEAPVNCETPNVVARLEMGLFSDNRGLKDVMYGARLLQVTEPGQPGYERKVREIGSIGLGSLGQADVARLPDQVARSLAENVELSYGFVKNSVMKIVTSREKVRLEEERLRGHTNNVLSPVIFGKDL